MVPSPETSRGPIRTFRARNRVWLAQVRFGTSGPEIQKSCPILEIQEIAKISTFPENSRFQRFPGFQDRTGFRMVRSICVLMNPCSDPCVHCCPETASYNMHTARSNVHTHIDTQHSCQSANSCHASILYSFARFCAIVRFENNFWNK